MKWAATEDLIEINPAPLVRKPTIASRERVLSDSELKAIWKATRGGDSFARMTRFLLLTAQRRDEAATLTFGDIAGDCGGKRKTSRRVRMRSSSGHWRGH